MPRRRYQLSIEATDKTPGWRLHNRVVPRRYTIRIEKLIRVIDKTPGRAENVEWTDLSDDEYDEVLETGATVGDDWAIGLRTWLEIEVESSPTIPPRCVVLRAPHGISTPELRFPLAGVVTEATAAIASRDGTFTDLPHGAEYGDMVFEASRARGRRKRTRLAITQERLEEVAEIARQHPRTPTLAVMRHFDYSRSHARKLIKLANSV